MTGKSLGNTLKFVKVFQKDFEICFMTFVGLIHLVFNGFLPVEFFGVTASVKKWCI